MSINQSEIVWKNPEDALNALILKDEQVITEAENFWIWEIQCTEITHRNERAICDFINNQFLNLENLVLPV
jgi:hypothetical protein